tara:strand:- start:917 stop:3574 length:2658 start_codon:yes stop_codon:yes gene_type:complete
METHARAANRGSVPTGYNIDNSVKIETTANEWLYRASPTAGNRKTFTFSFWVKRTEIGTVNASGSQYVIGQGQHGRMYFGSDYFQFRFDDGHDVRDVTTVFRDTAAWYHIVVAVDTNQSSSSNRVKLYFNGVQTTTLDFDGGSYPDIQDSASGWFTTNYLTIGTAPFGGSYNSGDGDYEMCGYLADFCAIDGQQLAPTDFGEYDEDSGIWKPIDVSGLTFGSEGFYLPFSNAAALGEDFSGNDNDFALSNLTAADQATDTPTNNFCTLDNNLRVGNQYGRFVQQVTHGGTRTDEPTGSFNGLFGTHSFNSGKWYWEIKQYYPTSAVNLQSFGISSIKNTGSQEDGSSGVHPAEPAEGLYPNAIAGIYPQGGGTTSYAHGTSSSANDNLGAGANGKIFQIAFDADAGKIWFGANDTWQDTVGGTQPSKSDIAAGNNARYDDMNDYKEGAWIPIFGVYNANNGNYMDVNFGGYTAATPSSAQSDQNGYGTFEYEPPAGFLALCSKNLGAETVIDDPSEHFQTKTYTGNGTSQAITFDGNSDLQPDLLLLKSADADNGWWLTSSVQGPTLGVYPDNPNYGPLTSGSGNDVTSYNTNGFSVGNPQHANSTNGNGSVKVAYAWKMNGGNGGNGVKSEGGGTVQNNDGNLSSWVQVNSTAKQVAGSYAGSGNANIQYGHGLGVKPYMLWIRATTRVENIRVYEYGGETANGGMSITNTNAQVNNNNVLLYAKPDATDFATGTDLSVGGNGHTYQFWAWAEVAGYSYFGKYHGNGYHNTAGTYPVGKDGPFVHTGFRPAFIMIKRSDTSGSWTVYDDARDPQNGPVPKALFLNASGAEAAGNISGNDIEWYSNGFKVKSADNTVNQLGGFYSVMAFAKYPQQTSAGVPATAR